MDDASNIQGYVDALTAPRSKTPVAQAGFITGIKSATGPVLKAIERAMEMLGKSKADPIEPYNIYRETGAHLLPGHWMDRYKDSGRFNLMAVEEGRGVRPELKSFKMPKEGETVPLPDVMRHDEFYKRYPSELDAKVGFPGQLPNVPRQKMLGKQWNVFPYTREGTDQPFGYNLLGHPYPERTYGLFRQGNQTPGQMAYLGPGQAGELWSSSTWRAASHANPFPDYRGEAGNWIKDNIWRQYLDNLKGVDVPLAGYSAVHRPMSIWGYKTPKGDWNMNAAQAGADKSRDIFRLWWPMPPAGRNGP